MPSVFNTSSLWFRKLLQKNILPEKLQGNPGPMTAEFLRLNLAFFIDSSGLPSLSYMLTGYNCCYCF
jgi:hypothetical protein